MLLGLKITTNKQTLVVGVRAVVIVVAVVVATELQYMHSVFQEPQSDVSASPPETGMVGLKSALQQFMETSPLGEFCTRLQLVKAFLCQVTYMENAENRGAASGAPEALQNH